MSFSSQLWLPRRQTSYYTNQDSVNAAIKAGLEADAVAYWKLDEASGVRVDSAGANDLTDNNTVTSAAGKVGNAAQFVAANSEYLSIADNAALSVDGAGVTFLVDGWIYLASKVDGYIAAKTNPAIYSEFALGYDLASDRFRLAIHNFAVTVSATTLGSPALATWYYIVGWHDAAADTLNIRVNNGATDSVATAGATIVASAGDFRVGSYDGTQAYWDGLIDELGFWKRIFTADEFTYRYNGGNGRTLF